MKTLHHNQLCYVAAWGREEAFSIGTLEGYAAESGSDINKALERAKANGHDIVWSINPGKAITNSDGYYDRLRALQASATEIAGGELVSIEGRTYTVKLMGARYSDPVHFLAVAEELSAPATCGRRKWGAREQASA